LTYDDRVVEHGGGTRTITRTWTASDGFSGAVCEQRIDQVCVGSGACCDHDAFGGCQDDRTLEECVCGNCEWFKERTCEQIDCTREAIPTVSEWGLVILTLLLLTGAKIWFGWGPVQRRFDERR
jgi:hypothetical protein